MPGAFEVTVGGILISRDLLKEVDVEIAEDSEGGLMLRENHCSARQHLSLTDTTVWYGCQAKT